MQFMNPSLIAVGAAGTEDVLVDDQGRVYTGVADGRILRISEAGDRIETIAAVPGRPLGLEFSGDDELIVCASDAGLLAVKISTGEVRTLVDKVNGSPIIACNNAAVASDGTIYFSDSSQRYVIPEWLTDIIEQTCTGRLLRRTPDGRVDELLAGLHFANGVALAPDESFVTVAESGGCRVRRVWLTGERAGTSDVFVDDLSGYPDNASTGTDGLIWVAVPSPKVAALDIVRKLPRPLRLLVTKLPAFVRPGPKPAVGVLGLNTQGQIVESYEGEIPGFVMLTGVRECDGRLYFGSLYESSVAILDR